MPQNYAQGAAGMATGSMPQQAQQGQPPITTATGEGTQTTQINEIMSSLKQLLPQVIDDKGYVNMDRLITMWPQFSQVSFQIVMQLIKQNPEILNNLISQYGLNGIIAQGRIISSDELAAMGSRGGGGM